MNLLLDTHALAWLASDHPKLSKKLVAQMAMAATRLLVSAVTAYEYSDLLVRGRLPTEVDLDALQAAFGFALLDYPAELWSIATVLPDIHRDPIDRMLIAHAIAIDATLVSADDKVPQYPVKTLW